MTLPPSPVSFLCANLFVILILPPSQVILICVNLFVSLGIYTHEGEVVDIHWRGGACWCHFTDFQ